MKNFIFNNNDVIGIVANDAGAANLILGWITKYKEFKYLFSVSGPAKKTFKDANLIDECLDLNNLISLCSVVITGTSFNSMLEHQARYKAKMYNITSIGVIDHWVNYKSRFIRNGTEVLPDLIWVFDEYAEEIAKNIFPKTSIEKQKNFYVENLVYKIKNIEKKSNYLSDNILYVLEPIRVKHKKGNTPFEFKVLNFFISKINQLGSKDVNEIRLRLHPSESIEKYDQWISKNQKLKISLSFDNSLEEDIAWSDIVVGYESFALVIANACNKKCFSSKLPNEENSKLMIKDLEYIRDLN